MILYYVLDTETTGLKSGYHEVNQISIIRLDDDEQITIDIAVDHPERAAYQALQVQGKTLKDLDKGVDKGEAVRKISEFIESDGQTPEHRCIVGHNVIFDRKFCHEMWDSVGVVFPANLWLCTKQFAQKYAKRTGTHKIAKTQHMPKAKYGLNIFMEGVGLEPKVGAHSASVDTDNTSTLLGFLWDSGIDYVSLIKRIPHKEDKKDTGKTDWVDFE